MLRTPKPRQQAEILTAELKVDGVELAHTRVLNVVAKLNGARHWGALPKELRAEDASRPETGTAYTPRTHISSEGWSIMLQTIELDGTQFGAGVAYVDLFGASTKAFALTAGTFKHVTTEEHAPQWLIEHGLAADQAQQLLDAANAADETANQALPATPLEQAMRNAYNHVMALAKDREPSFTTSDLANLLGTELMTYAQIAKKAAKAEQRQAEYRRLLHLRDELEFLFSEWRSFEDDAETEAPATAALDRRADFDTWVKLTDHPEAKEYLAVLARAPEYDSDQELYIARKDAAQQALENYDFGEAVGETDGWEYVTPGRSWSLNVYLEDETDPDADSYKVTFYVDFEGEKNAKVIRSYVRVGRH